MVQLAALSSRTILPTSFTKRQRLLLSASSSSSKINPSSQPLPALVPNRFFVAHFVKSDFANEEKDDAKNHENEEKLTSSNSFDERRRWLLQSLTSASASLVLAGARAGPTWAASASSNEYLVPTPPNTRDLTWPVGKVAFSLLPLAGTFTRRATIETCLVPDTMWTHDQIQGIVNVNVPVRQTVVRLRNGNFWIHNPVAPTPQLLRMIQTLLDRYENATVEHIVLGTVALEHKATFGAFCSYFPEATVWIQPGQWAFPLNLPIEFYGLTQRGAKLRELPILQRTHDTTVDPSSSVTLSRQYQYYAEQNPIPDWVASGDFDYEILGPFSFQSVGGFSETAFYHKPTHSLIVTDTVVSVTDEPPAIVQEDPRALLYHARDNIAQDIPADTSAVRQKGWRHMVQFGLVFFPSQIDVVPNVATAVQEAQELVPRRLRNLGEGAIPGGTGVPLYPWSWRSNDADRINFETISQQGKLFCPPILTKLILDREPTRTLEWVDRVCRMARDMKRIVPCHLNNNIRVSDSKQFYEAFDALRSRPGNLIPQRALAEDLALLQAASDFLTKYNIVAPSQVCDGEPARQKGRFATK